jgi:hypothetical protein
MREPHIGVNRNAKGAHRPGGLTIEIAIAIVIAIEFDPDSDPVSDFDFDSVTASTRKRIFRHPMAFLFRGELPG